MGSSHDAAEDGSAAGVVAKEFQEIARNSVEEQVRPEHLAFKFLALQHPGEDAEVRQLDSRFEKLCRFQRYSERSTHPRMGQRVFEGYAPEMSSWLAIATASRKTTHAPNCMPQS